MATQSSVLAWRIPGTGEPVGLPSMGSHRVGHYWSDLAAAAAEWINSRISEAEERSSELEDKMVEITSEEQNKVKRMKRIEVSVRDLWDNIKHTNIRIIGVPEDEEKKKGYEKIFEEIILENFPNMEKEIVNWVQEAQRVPYRINPRRNTSRHILIKLTKTKHKERILKAAREKQQVDIRETPYA